ncbi:DUF2510 domain-containing protein [Streptomyces sp. NBC_01317]|uniref:DUF2510 domain-containing protein n=1 Tax=Streptomyces sp. NBC_01317 TaxID=2903822 RepID=UPI002E11440F
MTYSTPPGWHPDPGHTGDGPRLERWWDGSAWTEELRSATPDREQNQEQDPGPVRTQEADQIHEPDQAQAHVRDAALAQDAGLAQDPAQAQDPDRPDQTLVQGAVDRPHGPDLFKGTPPAPVPDPVDGHPATVTAPVPVPGPGPVPPAPPAGAGWGQPQYPPYPLGTAPGTAPGTPNRKRRIGFGAIAAVVVLAIAGGSFLLGRGTDDNSDNTSAAGDGGSSAAPSLPGVPGPGQRGRSPAPDAPPGQGEGGSGGGGEDGAPQLPQPQTEDGFATDGASGISIPVPTSWKGESGPIGAGVTTGDYPCPGETSQTCVLGGVFSAPAAALEINAKTAKDAAEKDIEANAKDSYGGATYGEISSHQQLKAEAVTVAGQKGYLVRWKVVTSKGDDGYVQSLAFPSPANQELIVIVRSGFDVNVKAPKLTVMDDITKGIKKAAGGGTGTGQGV